MPETVQDNIGFKEGGKITKEDNRTVNGPSSHTYIRIWISKADKTPIGVSVRDGNGWAYSNPRGLTVSISEE